MNTVKPFTAEELAALKPIERRAALEDIERLEKAYAKGNKRALFDAISYCADFDLVMPAWVSRAFIEGWFKVVFCGVGSWDEAFGKPYPKGKHLGEMQKDAEARFGILSRVEELRADEGAALGDDLFERVGQEFNMSKTRANRLYYEAKKRWARFLPRKS